jgi:hypothetical protein
MKIQTFKLTARVKDKKVETLDTTRELIDEGNGTEFEESKIAFKAQEVAQFNSTEVESIKQMGDGDYTIEFKLIV